MSLKKKLATVTFAITIAFIMSTAGAEIDLTNANVSNGRTIFMNGKGDVPACTACHAEDGMGNEAMGTPRLSGQIYEFLVKQLEDYATDRRMDTTMYVMNTNAKGLTQQDRIDVAAYLSTTGAEPKPADPAELGDDVGKTHLGLVLVNFGDAKKGIPACRSCHDFNGRGVPPMYPDLGHQRYSYLVSQLKKWRDGSRNNDVMGQMQAVAKNMSDDDIKNAAAYLAIKGTPYSMGNTRRPVVHVPFNQ